MLKYYKLDENKQPIECELLEWADMREDTEGRTIGNDEIVAKDGTTAHITTMFHGEDFTNALTDNEPQLFGTLITVRREEGGETQEELKAKTWEEAEKNHRDLVGHYKFALGVK